MSNLREAAQQALEVLERAGEELRWQAIGQVQRDLRAALAEPEPFQPDWANYRQGVKDGQAKPLTDEEIDALDLPPSGTATVRDLVGSPDFHVE